MSVFWMGLVFFTLWQMHRDGRKADKHYWRLADSTEMYVRVVDALLDERRDRLRAGESVGPIDPAVFEVREGEAFAKAMAIERQRSHGQRLLRRALGGSMKR